MAKETTNTPPATEIPCVFPNGSTSPVSPARPSPSVFRAKAFPSAGKSSAARLKKSLSYPSPRLSNNPAAHGNPRRRSPDAEVPLRLRVSGQFGVWQTVLLPCSSFFAQLRLERLLRGCKFHARFFLPPELRQNPASQEVTALYVWLKLQGRINHFQSRLQLLLLLIELGQT